MAEVKDITIGHIAGIISNLIIVHSEGAVSQNEICFVKTGDEKLLS
jgi:V/A-type H+-transporting ATPase subunit A